MISLKLDTTLPHPYCREFAVNGTRGFYNQQGNVALTDGEFDHEKDIDEYYGSAEKYADCMPLLWRNMMKEQIDSGHGGMDYLLLRAFVDAIRNGEEMPIDVYDAASWMAITCLSEESVSKGGVPVAIPDFTNGQWIMRERKDVVRF